MARRVILDSTAASPLRMSVAGIDAAGAEFNDLIFDANQSPLRLAGTGYLLIDGMTKNQFTGGQNIRTSHTGSPVTTPAGTTAVFMVAWRMNTAGQPLYTPFVPNVINFGTNGGGGGICSNLFVGACFNIAPVPAGNDELPPPNYTNYCIFKNYN
jgi:hypothetical protein